jgi:hypothetical protein
MSSQQEVEKAISNILICCCTNRGNSEHCKNCGKRTVKAQIREIITSLTEAHKVEMEKMVVEILNLGNDPMYGDDRMVDKEEIKAIAKKFNIEIK